jgi:cytochrome c peroxidase
MFCRTGVRKGSVSTAICAGLLLILVGVAESAFSKCAEADELDRATPGMGVARSDEGQAGAELELPQPEGAGALPARTRSALLWSESERAMLRSLSIRRLERALPDPTNRVSDDPRAAALGHRLFFDPGLSGSGQIACASCHQPSKLFTDGRVRGHGEADLGRNTPAILGIGYAHWLNWDGSRDTAWSQALSPIEAPREMNGTRTQAVRLVSNRPGYRSTYEALFGPLPNLDGVAERASPIGDAAAAAAWNALVPAGREAVTRAFVNIGKVIAAYERLLVPGVSTFDEYVDAIERNDFEAADRLLEPMAVGGLKLFLSSNTQCLNCHNGPLFTDGAFHNIGTGPAGENDPDAGRSAGIRSLLATEFNCRGPYSDAPASACPEVRLADGPIEASLLAGAYKVPSLRNIARTGPYMHDGRFATLAQVLGHYRNPRSAMIEFRPFFDMATGHVDALVAFLKTLNSPVDAPEEFLRPPAEALAP